MKIAILPKGVILLSLGGYKKRPFSTWLATNIHKYLYKFMSKGKKAIIANEKTGKLEFINMAP